MERKDLLVAAGVTAVLSLGWYQFVWQAQGASATKAERSARSAEDATSKLRTQVTSLERTKADLVTKTSLKAQLDQAIPATPELSALMKDVQALAGQRQVVITQISNGGLQTPPDTSATATTKPGATAAPAATPATEMLVTLSLNGDYANVVQFMNDLASMPRLVVIDSVALNPTTSADAPGKAVSAAASVSATVVARVFTTAPSPGAVAAAAAANPSGTTTATTAAAKSGTQGGL